MNTILPMAGTGRYGKGRRGNETTSERVVDMTDPERLFLIRKRLERIRGSMLKLSGWIEEITMMLYKVEFE